MNNPNYQRLLRGKGAHADPVASLASVPFAVAGKILEGYPHSIWQLVGHMNYWMEYELQRIAGKRPKYPEHAIEGFPASLAPASEGEWEKARDGFAARIGRLAELSDAAPEILNAPVDVIDVSEEARSSSAEEVLWQIMVHNSYHVGQIAMMMRCFGLWPPPTGADTW
jgi:uncharacterized damage-inducible protein DinB